MFWKTWPFFIVTALVLGTPSFAEAMTMEEYLHTPKRGEPKQTTPVPALSPWIASYCGQGTCSWTGITEVEKVQVNERETFYPVHIRDPDNLKYSHGGLVVPMDTGRKQSKDCNQWFDGKNWKKVNEACQQDKLCLGCRRDRTKRLAAYHQSRRLFGGRLMNFWKLNVMKKFSLVITALIV